MFGFAHHALLGLVVIAVIVFAGLKVLTGTHALTEDSSSSSAYINGKIYSGGFTMNQDGSGVIDLHLPSSAQEQSSMSFGGGRVAYWNYDSTCNSNTIYKGTISDSSITNISAVASLSSGVCPMAPPAWSPDGTKLAERVTTPTEQRIWVVKTDGSNPHFVKNVSAYGATGGYILSPYISWVPGSGKIMYALVGGGTGTGSYNSKICTITTDGLYKTCHPIVLPDGVTAGDYLGHAGLAVSPTGNKVALVTINGSDPTKAPSADIYTIKPDGTGLKRLTTLPAGQQAQGVVWSPNGQKIAYILTDAYSPRGNGLYVMNADGSNPQLISSDNAYFHPPSVSWAHQ